VSARRRWTALTCALLASACGDASLRGSWAVVGYKRPVVSALGDLEAQMRLGDTLHVSASEATLGDRTCVIDGTARQSLAVRDLEMAYDLSRGELGLTQERVEVVDLECGEGGLDYGEQLIRVGRDSLLTPWDGIFLLLEKARS
jgi:hypothetical protein